MTARLFTLERDVDTTGISGEGVVCEGVVFSDGTVVYRWLRHPRSTVVRENDAHLAGVYAVHGHDGATRVVWL